MSHLEFQEKEWQDLESFWADLYVLDDQPAKESVIIPPTKSTEILKQYITNVKRLREENLQQINDDSCCEPLSTETIMKLAKARLQQLRAQKVDILSNVKGCFGGTRFAQMTQLSKDLEIALLIQVAAENVANKHMVYAKKLLSLYGRLASTTVTVGKY